MLFAGPCAIEDEKQGYEIAKFVKAHGATCFRAGAWKGQNRPFPNGKPAYWGMGIKGAKLLGMIRRDVGIPVITEVQSEEQVDWVLHYGIDYLQIGARHMQNFPLLRAIPKRWQGQIVLKRGLGNTVDEWLGAAEHLGGVDRVILCERGVSHFDRTSQTRWRLDMVGAAYIKHYTKYRLIIDPSHGSGDRNLVLPLAKAALQIADGLMVEVHYDPDSSPTDANQTIDFDTFKKIERVYGNNYCCH